MNASEYKKNGEIKVKFQGPNFRRYMANVELHTASICGNGGYKICDCDTAVAIRRYLTSAPRLENGHVDYHF